MLNFLLKVEEAPQYHIRTYTLPEPFKLLQRLDAVTGTSATDFADIEVTDCSPQTAASVLGQELFKIPGVKHVEMHRRSFVITYDEGTNGPESDVAVLKALRVVIAQTLTYGLHFTSVFNFSS